MLKRGWLLWRSGLMGIGVIFASAVFGQSADGDKGINKANEMVRDYFTTGINLMYAIGGILAVVGAIRVYTLWVNGDPHTTRVAAAWFSACIFLIVVAEVIKAFYGL